DHALSLLQTHVRHVEAGKKPVTYFVDDYYRNNDGDFIFRLKTVVDDNMPHNDANKPNDSWVTAEEVAKMEEVDLEY
ncbi:hypothetical protein, partial [Aetokthonos hydrillicola]|uniref:hypothetical protein n=1 Tax=Aetokthonos hydrillicola TaxID=1550245 RepID=UPI001ABB45F3